MFTLFADFRRFCIYWARNFKLIKKINLLTLSLRKTAVSGFRYIERKNIQFKCLFSLHLVSLPLESLSKINKKNISLREGRVAANIPDLDAGSDWLLQFDRHNKARFSCLEYFKSDYVKKKFF